VGKDDSIQYLLESKEVDEDLELPLLDWSEELTNKYFKSKDIKKLVIRGITEGFPSLQFVPVLVGSALYGEGIKEFLHFITLLSQQPKIENPNKAIIFKKQYHSLLGKVLYLKTYHSIEKGNILYCGNESFVVNRMYHMIPGGVQELVHAPAGTVIVLEVESGTSSEIAVKSKLQIGDIVSPVPTDTRINEHGISYSREFAIIIEPDKEEYREDVSKGLEKLCWEDPGLSFQKDFGTGQWELRGMGELHIEVATKRLESFIGEKFQIKNLRVAKYGICKSLAKKVIFEHSTFDGKWKSGTIHGFLESRTDFDNVVLFDTKVESAVKSSIESAFFEFLTHGWNGTPVLGLQLRISSYDAPEEFNEHTLSLIKVSIISGIKSYIQSNSATIGPTGHFEIVVPQSHVGTVISLLKKRSARVHSLEVIEDNKSLLKGEAAAEKLLGFTGVLRNMTQGKGSISIDIAFSFKDYSELSD
jgi:elongation factor G